MGIDYVTILCGSFNDGHKPLSRAEFWSLYHKYGDSVRGIVDSNEERVDKLLERSGSVVFAMEQLMDMGVRVAAFSDDDYPGRLHMKLGDFCPPVLYMCGDPGLARCRFAGYVGSRAIEESDMNWTKMMVENNIRDRFGIVSGGAKGIDTVSINHAIEKGGIAVAYLPDNLKSRIRDKYYRRTVGEGRLLLCSHVSPLAPKTRHSFVAAAMERNKFIYAQSSATAVVRSDYNKGGTWAGATEALRHKWAPVFVWDNKNYEGNQKLIELGGIPISDEGRRLRVKTQESPAEKKQPKTKQMDIFDYLDKAQDQ